MFQSLWVPLDGSKFGEHALPLALGIAQRAGAHLTVAHVHSPLEALYAPEGICFDDNLDARIKQGEQAYLDGIVKRLAQASSVQPASILLEGQGIASSLRQAASAKKADLMVMTTHGRGAMGRFWIGSVADQLVRDLPMPLLLVPPQEAAPDFAHPPTLKHMLVPLDGSPLAEQMLESAIALGTLTDADYTLLRVIKPVWPGGYDYSGASLGEEAQSLLSKIDKAQEQLRKEAEAYLERVASRLRSKSLRVRTVVDVAEQPATAVFKEAKGSAIDLVALATHGRRGVSRLFLGSVADKVIRGAGMPVLVHRPVQS
jgi:nucleotide-binding universal stress UspA family protein